MKKSGYAFVMLVSFVLMGCKDYKHNVVIDEKVQLSDKDFVVVFHEVGDTIERLYHWKRKPNLYDMIELDDPATIVCYGKKQEKYFNNHSIIFWNEAKMNMPVNVVSNRLPTNSIFYNRTIGELRVF